MNNNPSIDDAINEIVSGITATIVNGCKVPAPSADTTRAIRILVNAMFNWTKSHDIGAVGFQIQQIILMLMPDNKQETVLHLLGQSVEIFMLRHAVYETDCRQAWEQRRATMRATFAARKAQTTTA